MKTRNSGFTLAEVLVSIVIGVLVLLQHLHHIIILINHINQFHKKQQLIVQQEKHLTVISRDLKNAGYVDINYNKVAKSEIKSIYLQQKTLESLDSLTIWYTASPNDMMQVEYKPTKYQGSNKKYLARSVVMNPGHGTESTLY